jgi:preprotein translocase subunit SecG
MYQVLTVFHVLIALTIIGLVLLQQGRGADAGAGFGGASNTLFGARGAASFLSRTTKIFASLFFATSLALAYLAGHQDNKKVDIMDVPEANSGPRDLPAVTEEPTAPKQSDVPVAPAAPQPSEPKK